MIRTASLLLIATAMNLVGPARANEKLKVGENAPVYAQLPGVDGKTHSLADFKDKDVVVLVITCNHCPVAVAYEDRIIAFARKYAGPNSKVAVVAINVNKGSEDSLPRMVERSREKGFNFPYLFDGSQKIARALGATYTPEFFVLNRDRKVVYMGAMDDKTDRPSVNYLEPAVQAALNGELPKTTETTAHGCKVKYDRSRR
jgi:peroxiredoxin